MSQQEPRAIGEILTELMPTYVGLRPSQPATLANEEVSDKFKSRVGDESR